MQENEKEDKVEVEEEDETEDEKQTHRTEENKTCLVDSNNDESEQEQTRQQEYNSCYRIPCTHQEQDTLARGITRYGTDNIEKLSTLLSTRTKARWTCKEQEALARGITRYGKNDIAKLSTLIPTRTEGSIREYVRRNYSIKLSEERKEHEGAEISLANKRNIEDTNNENSHKEKKGNASGAVVRTTGVWSLEEHEKCAESLVPHGNCTSYKAMSEFMKSRSPQQIQSYYTRNKMKLLRDSKKYISRQQKQEEEGASSS